jgi:hypothetical protein
MKFGMWDAGWEGEEPRIMRIVRIGWEGMWDAGCGWRGTTKSAKDTKGDGIGGFEPFAL